MGPGLGQVFLRGSEAMVTVPGAFVLGFVFASVICGLIVEIIVMGTWWRERRARRKAINEILSRAAVLHD